MLITDFDLWKWVLPRQYITDIKQIVITSKSPIEGQLTFGCSWYPINKQETLYGWLANHFINKMEYCDVIFLSQVNHPISSTAQNIINRSRSHYEEMIDIHIQSFELGDMDGLNKCLADTNHKYHETMKESIEIERGQILAPKYFMLEVRDVQVIIKHLINHILSTCYDPNFKLVDIPKISVSQTIYGIFPDKIRLITTADNVMWSQKGTIIDKQKIKDRLIDKERFEFVINNWIPDIDQRETFRQYAKNIIQGLPWKDVFHVRNGIYESYQPYEILKWLFTIMNQSGDINHINAVNDVVQHENNNMYIYFNISIPRKYSTIGYGIERNNQQYVIPDNKFLLGYLGDDVNKQENFFERQREYLLSLILWSLGDDFPCQWNTII